MFIIDLLVESYFKNKTIGVTIVKIINMSFTIFRKGLTNLSSFLIREIVVTIF